MAGNWQERTVLLLGEERFSLLEESRLLLVGLGGVGSWAAEMISRAGVSKITLVDGDVVDVTNTNRQLPALVETIGRPKAQVMAERLAAIRPGMELDPLEKYIEKGEVDHLLDRSDYDLVIDAIDTLTPKCELLQRCHERKVPIVSSMGAGGRLDPCRIKHGDLYDSHGCPLASEVRRRMRSAGVGRGIGVVFSDEPIEKRVVQASSAVRGKASKIGTISYLPTIFGCHLASMAVDILSCRSHSSATGRS